MHTQSSFPDGMQTLPASNMHSMGHRNAKSFLYVCGSERVKQPVNLRGRTEQEKEPGTTPRASSSTPPQ